MQFEIFNEMKEKKTKNEEKQNRCMLEFIRQIKHKIYTDINDWQTADVIVTHSLHDKIVNAF